MEKSEMWKKRVGLGEMMMKERGWKEVVKECCGTTRR